MRCFSYIGFINCGLSRFNLIVSLSVCSLIPIMWLNFRDHKIIFVFTTQSSLCYISAIICNNFNDRTTLRIKFLLTSLNQIFTQTIHLFWIHLHLLSQNQIANWRTSISLHRVDPRTLIHVVRKQFWVVLVHHVCSFIYLGWSSIIILPSICKIPLAIPCCKLGQKAGFQVHLSVYYCHLFHLLKFLFL